MTVKKKSTTKKSAALVRSASVEAAKHPSALDRRDHGGAPLKLTKEEDLVLMEAVRRGESAQRKNQDTMMEYGQWLLDTVFKGKTKEALDPKSKNTVWMELVRRSGGPTLHVSTRFLYVALRIAAYDKRITDESWRLLDSGRKELLLPLVDVDALRDAARHVTKFDLTHKMVQAYVTSQLTDGGDRRQVRWTGSQMTKQLEKVHSMFEERASIARLREFRRTLTDDEKSALVDQTKALQATLANVLRELRR